jgi:hypothetical protein
MFQFYLIRFTLKNSMLESISWFVLTHYITWLSYQCASLVKCFISHIYCGNGLSKWLQWVYFYSPIFFRVQLDTGHAMSQLTSPLILTFILTFIVAFWYSRVWTFKVVNLSSREQVEDALLVLSRGPKCCPTPDTDAGISRKDPDSLYKILQHQISLYEV